MPGYVIIPKVIETIEHPFGKGDLTANGAQVSVAVNTATANEFVTVESKPINIFGGVWNTVDHSYDAASPGAFSGDLTEVEFGLTMEVRATGGQNTTPAYYMWQAKNLQANTWVDLFAEQTQLANIADTWHTRTWSGRANLTNASFNQIPFEVRALVKTNVANANATHTPMMARTKNSSYVKALYRIA